jgi:tetratricopeptide (TPR) repeat protein
MALGQWDVARDYLTEWIKSEDNIKARIQRARVFEELRDWAGATKDIDRAREIDPAYPELRKFSSAPAQSTIQNLDALIAESPRDAKRWQARATELTRLRRFKAALEDIEKARNLEPDSVRLMLDQAHLLWQLQRPIPPELQVQPSETWTSEEATFPAAFDAMQSDLNALSQVDAKVQETPDQPALYLERNALLIRLHQTALAEKDSQRASQLQTQPSPPP